MSTQESHRQPHRDSDAWPLLVEGLAVEAILVLISSWMGPKLRQEMGPEDLWQETLYCAWRDRAQHEWRGLASYRRWVLGIARNRVREAVTHLGALKRGGGQRPLLLSVMSETCGEDGSVSGLLPAYSQTPSRSAMRSDRVCQMERALLSLPDEYRLALRLRLFEQRSLKDVAAQLELSLASTKKRVYLAAELYRNALREAISQVASWPERGS